MSDQMSMGEELLERYDVSLLEQRFLDLGITLTKEQEIRFLQYYEYLVEKNQVMNLTAITEYEAVVEKHFADSLAAAAVYDIGKAEKCDRCRDGSRFSGDSAEDRVSAS